MAVIAFRFRSAHLRRIAALALVLLVPLFGGCVYLRLLQLKNQLADFDRHFSLDDSAGLKLGFKSPVLLDDDMSFLGMKTTLREKSGVAERWTLRWRKTPASGDPRDAIYEQSVDFGFVRGRMTTVLLPERFFVFFPKNVLVAGLRAMGRARVDREKRAATAEVQAQDQVGVTPFLPLEALRKTIGAPNRVTEDGAYPEWHYSFQPTPECAGSGAIDLAFTIDPQVGTVRRVRGKLVFGTFDFWYPTPASTHHNVNE